MHSLVGKAGYLQQQQQQKTPNVTFFYLYKLISGFFYSGHWNYQSLLITIQMTGEGLTILAWQRPHNLVTIIKTAMEE